jgi:L-cystine uptake protein TcyP (sodium:dicarboxylate symporter family)
MDLHIEVTLLALLGLALQLLLKYKSLKDKATKSNVALNFWEFVKQDFLSILATIVMIIIFVFVLDDIVNLHVKAIYWVKFLFVFAGYTGSDLILRLFGVTNRKLNNIIDKETGQSMDKINIEEGKTDAAGNR